MMLHLSEENFESKWENNQAEPQSCLFNFFYDLKGNQWFRINPLFSSSIQGRHGLKLNIQKTKIMASSPITSWEIDGETVETVPDFIFLGSKITTDDDCSHEIKRRLLLGRKVMTNLDSIFKSRDITFPTKVCLVKAMFFPVVMYGCESWTVKKAEHRRIDAFELWCWRRLLRVPWTATRSSQSILKEISPGISLEVMMLKLKLQYLATSREELTHWKRLWCWEGLGARGEGDDRGWDGWMASLTQWTWVSVNSGSWWWTGRPGMLRFMGSQRVGHDWATDLIWSIILDAGICMRVRILKALRSNILDRALFTEILK